MSARTTKLAAIYEKKKNQAHMIAYIHGALINKEDNNSVRQTEKSGLDEREAYIVGSCTSKLISG